MPPYLDPFTVSVGRHIRDRPAPVGRLWQHRTTMDEISGNWSLDQGATRPDTEPYTSIRGADVAAKIVARTIFRGAASPHESPAPPHDGQGRGRQ